jgi:hypothetical protein
MSTLTFLVLAMLGTAQAVDEWSPTKAIKALSEKDVGMATFAEYRNQICPRQADEANKSTCFALYDGLISKRASEKPLLQVLLVGLKLPDEQAKRISSVVVPIYAQSETATDALWALVYAMYPPPKLTSTKGKKN